MKLGKEIPRREFNKWIKALRSGEYTQTNNALQDKRGFCCLGVACAILIPKEKHILDLLDRLVGCFPSNQKAPTWLKDINADFQEKMFKLKIDGDSSIWVAENCALSDLNDQVKMSFNEIADMLELVYIYECWD